VHPSKNYSHTSLPEPNEKRNEPDSKSFLKVGGLFLKVVGPDGDEIFLKCSLLL